MKPVPLESDLGMLASQCPLAREPVMRLRAPGLDPPSRMALLARVAEQARLDPYRTLALLLKMDWEASSGPWRPWEDVSRFAMHLPPVPDGQESRDVELLVLEQCVLSCHLLGTAQVGDLAERHLRIAELLSDAPASERRAFASDRRDWLRGELQLDELLGIHSQLVDELELTRAQCLEIIGRANEDFVDAAHRLALARYRLALDDPTLTPEKLERHLISDLDWPCCPVELHPELRLALRETTRGLRADHDEVRRLLHLQALGQTRPATDEERQHAKSLWRKLRSWIFPARLEQREGYEKASPENRARLREIWNAASATNGVRVHLSRERLLGYAEHLAAWIDEVEKRIFPNMGFHAPSRLLGGDTVPELQADLHRALAEVRNSLHAVRDEIACLEFDPQHSEYRRVIALDAEGRDEECTRLWALAERWDREARELEAQIATRVAEATRADAAQIKENKP